MRRFMIFLSGPVVSAFGGFSITAILILTRHALSAASPLV